MLESTHQEKQEWRGKTDLSLSLKWLVTISSLSSFTQARTMVNLSINILKTKKYLVLELIMQITKKKWVHLKTWLQNDTEKILSVLVTKDLNKPNTIELQSSNSEN